MNSCTHFGTFSSGVTESCSVRLTSYAQRASLLGMQTLRYRAFTTPAGGGNPAGVVTDASDMNDAEMQSSAAEIGYSETSFLTKRGEREYAIRYFSPEAEVDFCGHATVATAVALAEEHGGAGQYVFHSNVGEIQVMVEPGDGGFSATLESVTPETAELDALPELLELLGWEVEDLDAALPTGVAFAGLWHPILWASTRQRLAALDYNFEGLRRLMLQKNWGTVSLLYRESDAVIHSRNAFPIGGVVEDPATGAAAAALGGFLRAHALLPGDGRFVVLQGEDMGQPCRIEVDASGAAGVRVSGVAEQVVR